MNQKTDPQKILFDLQKRLNVKVGLQKPYKESGFKYGNLERIYHYDLHIEDLENGIAPESPGIFGSNFGKIDQRELDRETLRGWH